MIHSKSQSKRRTVGRRSLLLLAVLSLVISLLGLPLYASTVGVNSPAGRVVDDIKRGARDIGRGARDLVDPDRDGILPDGSVDNGIAGDGNQFDDEHSGGRVTDHVTGPIPDSNTGDGVIDEIMPDSPVTDNNASRPSPDDGNGTATDNNAGDMTDPDTNTTNGTATTDAPATSDTPATTGPDGENADNTGNEEGGFRWTGLIIAIIIAVAVIVLIWLLIPKKKNR